MKYLKTIFVALILVVFCILYVQNEEVFTHQFRLNFDLSVYKIGPYLVYNVALIGVAFVIGVIFSVLYGVLHSSGKSSEVNRKNERIRELEDEVSDLRKRQKSSASEKSAFGSSPFTPPSGAEAEQE